MVVIAGGIELNTFVTGSSVGIRRVREKYDTETTAHDLPGGIHGRRVESDRLFHAC